MIRFLDIFEYKLTLPLYLKCFGEDSAFEERYYQGDINDCRVAVKEIDGHIVSMVHIKSFTTLDEETFSMERVGYLMCIATDPKYRHQGHMDDVMKFVIDALNSEGMTWCFLITAQPEIYRHLGFVHDWNLKNSAIKMSSVNDRDQGCVKLLNRAELPDLKNVKLYT